jgi:hypothetical protein
MRPVRVLNGCDAIGYDGGPWSGSDKAEHCALVLPVEGNAGIPHQPRGREASRLTTVQDGLDDVGREPGQPEQPRGIGLRDALLCRKGCQARRLAGYQRLTHRQALATSRTSDGSDRSAATLIQTAKLNGVDPQAWLTDVLERIVSGRTKAAELDTLLPWYWRPNADLPIAAAA